VAEGKRPDLAEKLQKLILQIRAKKAQPVVACSKSGKKKAPIGLKPYLAKLGLFRGRENSGAAKATPFPTRFPTKMISQGNHICAG
jgi:hypothetical protein